MDGSGHHRDPSKRWVSSAPRLPASTCISGTSTRLEAVSRSSDAQAGRHARRAPACRNAVAHVDDGRRVADTALLLYDVRPHSDSHSCYYYRVMARVRLHTPRPSSNGEAALRPWSLNCRLQRRGAVEIGDDEEEPSLPFWPFRTRQELYWAHCMAMTWPGTATVIRPIRAWPCWPCVVLCGSARCSRPLEGPHKRPGDWQKRKCLASRLLQISSPIRERCTMPRLLACDAGAAGPSVPKW